MSGDVDFREFLIQDSGLSTRAVAALRRAGFYRMREIMLADYWELKRIADLGAKSLSEVEDWFTTRGALIGGARQDALMQLEAARKRADLLSKQLCEAERSINELHNKLGGNW